MSSQPPPNPKAGAQSRPVPQQDQTQLQLDWLTACVFALQEQNQQLYEQVAMLNNAMQSMLNDSSGSKQHQGWTKEDEEMAKKWKQQGVVPCIKGKPIDYDKWMAANKRQEKSSKGA